MKLIQAISTTLLSLGVLLLIASFAWPHIVSADTVWSEKDAEAYIENSASFHKNSFDDEVSDAELAATRQAFADQKEKLESAIAIQQRTPTLLRMTGLAVCATGVVMLMVVKQQ